MTAAFGTFCHISQYGEWGYQVLPRMLAMSAPLNLWAPSSVLLSSPSSAIPAKTFLSFVESGKIRVFGREEWITDPSFRNSRRWPGTQWVPEIDEPIRDLCRQDKARPEAERRVIVAPPEEGYDWAESYIGSHPKEVPRWLRLLRGKRAASTVPAETLVAAQALLDDDPEQAVCRVLRDAHNHGRAFRDSGAVAPFLLNRTDRRFLQLLAAAPPSPDAPVPQPTRAETQAEIDTGLVAGQLVELLRHLDRHAGAKDPDALRRFLESEGHADLVDWMRDICRMLQQYHPAQVDDMVLRELRHDLHGAEFGRLAPELLRRKDEVAVSLLGLVSTAVGVATDPLGAMTLLGVTATAYPLGKGLARELGMAPATFSGPQWPFLYAYGTRAKKPQLARLRFLLDDLAAERAEHRPGPPPRSNSIVAGYSAFAAKVSQALGRPAS